LGQTFDQVYAQYSAEIPATATIDATSLGLDAPASISQALSDAEAGLREARSAIGIFRTYYVLLIVFMVLLVAGVIVIHREVKGASRDLGIVFLVYGALNYAGALTGRYFIVSAIKNGDIAAAIQSWLTGLVAAGFRPLEMLTLALAILGIALIVVSIVYRRTPGTPQVVGPNEQP
jgi:hypothetical protein